MNICAIVFNFFLVMVLLLSASVAWAGDVLEAQCSCGYFKTGLFAFAGRSNYRDVCMAPALCKATGEVVLCNILDDSKASPDCPLEHPAIYGGPDLPPLNPTRDIASWFLQSRGIAVHITDGAYTCPRCGEVSLRFRKIGSWD
ncbi:MAG: hypothetical protein HQK81_04080 [Desulfovibrionaceae bacterium]|nr:hypothetical protein [Desulfovibrionaceae bacterium]MBF0513222.1 hypothetical protein [Desulfovibrionaceae bacterium]